MGCPENIIIHFVDDCAGNIYGLGFEKGRNQQEENSDKLQPWNLCILCIQIVLIFICKYFLAYYLMLRYECIYFQLQVLLDLYSYSILDKTTTSILWKLLQMRIHIKC